jgi:uncharacterized iron-regulated membrane protein
MGINRWSRKAHRWGAILTAVPVLLIIVTGLLLQLKKDLAWVQPPTGKGGGQAARVDWEQILAAAQAVPPAAVGSWEDIERLDVRPGRSLIKIQCRNHWELQLDWTTGEVLHSAYRRSDWLEALHDGSFFGDIGKYYIILPTGLVLLGLWVSGAYLWYLPIHVRQQKRRKRSRAADEDLAKSPDR